jgi:hypothetical protein
MRESEYRDLTMEILMSPIGLMMVVIDLSLPTGLVEGRIFLCTENSQVWGDFYGTSHLSYRIRPPPRPP